MNKAIRNSELSVLKAIVKDSVRGVESRLRGLGSIDREIRRRHYEAPATLLAHACEHRAIRVAKFLIKSGAKPDRGRYYPPLLGAVLNGGKRIVQLLLDAGANPNVRALFNVDPSPDRDRDSRWTPLMAAAVGGNLDLVNLLLARGADPNLTTRLGLSALDFAIAHRHDRIIDRFIKAGGKASGLSLFSPIQRGDLPTIKRLIRAGADVNVPGNAAAGAIAGQTPLEAAVLERCSIDSDIRLELTNASGGSERTPQVAAEKRGYLEIIKALIQGGAKLNGPTRWRSPLLIAASGGDLELVKFFLKAGVDPNAAASVAMLERGRAALHNAALGGFAEIVEILIAAGADVSKPDGEGRTPIQSVREQTGSMEMMMAEVAISHGVEKTQEEIDAMRKDWQERRARIIAILERNTNGSRR